jgi:predicted RNase H-like HicB family nuclease
MADTVIIEFEVEHDEDGSYTASAQVDNHTLVTQGDTLDELHTMVEDLLRSFTANSGFRVLSYSLVFQPLPVAA